MLLNEMLFVCICTNAYVKIEAAECMHTHTEDSETKQKISHFQLSVLLVILPTYRASRKGLKTDFLRLFSRLVGYSFWM